MCDISREQAVLADKKQRLLKERESLKTELLIIAIEALYGTENPKPFIAIEKKFDRLKELCKMDL